MKSFLLGSIFSSLVWIVPALFVLVAILEYKARRVNNYKKILWSLVGFKLVYALIQTAGQYWIWSGSGFTSILLRLPAEMPIQGWFLSFFETEGGYFFAYSIIRFWLEPLISILLGLLLFSFLLWAERRKERFFVEGEVLLGSILSIASGWPGIIYFVALSLLLVLIFSVWKRLAKKEAYVTLGWPMAVSGLLVAFLKPLTPIF